MAYTIKDVFYLSTETIIASGTANGGSAQLDLSAYIDPIARGRQKGTGLAVYKTHYSMGQATAGEPIDDAEAGTLRFGLIAGLGANQWVKPSIEVPYVIVRDNVCLLYEVGDNFTSGAVLSVRLEVAQITLDQATLNQLLRTQTV
jgi:hypothetical protein